jgi:hypothetical protein
MSAGFSPAHDGDYRIGISGQIQHRAIAATTLPSGRKESHQLEADLALGTGHENRRPRHRSGGGPRLGLDFCAASGAPRNPWPVNIGAPESGHAMASAGSFQSSVRSCSGYQ